MALHIERVRVGLLARYGVGVQSASWFGRMQLEVRQQLPIWSIWFIQLLFLQSFPRKHTWVPMEAPLEGHLNIMREMYSIHLSQAHSKVSRTEVHRTGLMKAYSMFPIHKYVITLWVLGTFPLSRTHDVTIENRENYIKMQWIDFEASYRGLQTSYYSFSNFCVLFYEMNVTVKVVHMKV